MPDELLLVETDAPFLSPQERRGKPNEPAFVRRRPLPGRASRPDLRGARAGGRANAAALPVVTRPRARASSAWQRVRDPAEPRARAELPRRRQHPRRHRPRRRSSPGRRRARDRRGARRPERVPRAARRPPARDRDGHAARAGARGGARGSTRTPTRARDVMDVDLGGARARPGKVVANLPYGVAVPAILRTIDELPAVSALVRDGPARGRRPARRASRHEDLRSAIGAGPARMRRRVRAPDSRTVFQPARTYALIAFAGPGVVEKTTREKLPRTSAWRSSNLRFGHLDAIIPRPEQRAYMVRLLRLFGREAAVPAEGEPACAGCRSLRGVASPGEEARLQGASSRGCRRGHRGGDLALGPARPARRTALHARLRRADPRGLG